MKSQAAPFSLKPELTPELTPALTPARNPGRKRPQTHWLKTQALPLLAVSSLCVSAEAKAADKGFRIELGTSGSYALETDASGRYAGIGANASGEVWGLGPFGLLLQTEETASLSQVELTDAGFVPVTTYLFQVSAGPTLNFKIGPLAMFRLEAGPWLGYSWVKRETLNQLDESDVVPDWRQATFLGTQLQARMDMNLPILSPFVAVQGQMRALSSGEGVTVGANSYGSTDIKGTAGLRFNFIPLVKLSVEGFAGLTRNVLEPVTPTPQDLTRFGMALNLVIMH